MKLENESNIFGKRKLSTDALLKKVKRARKEYRRLKRDIEACERAMQYIKMGVPHTITHDHELVYNPMKHKKEPGIVTRFKVLDATVPFREMIRPLKVVILASGTPTTQLLAKPSEYKSIKMAHPIDKSRRMIYYKPIGKMNKDGREGTIPVMANEIAELHNFYGKNSIIHCASYDIAKAFEKCLVGSVKNLVCQDQDTKQDDFDRWQQTDDCLFLSVAMEQGIDLKGPRYPLNIIAKVNFPYLGDDWIQERNKLDNKMWYNITTALNVVQACGRTTRDPTDYSESWLLDASFGWFYNSHKKLFPNWFHEALVLV
jgi:Rad3-related DNA helicase